MDYSRSVEEWLREFNRRTGRELEVLSPDSREGADFVQAYDIVEYPTIVAVSEEGKVMEMWRGATLPTINEVSYYTFSDL